MAKTLYTLTLTENEHTAMSEFINRYLVEYSKELRIEGRSRVYLERATTKISNSKTVVIHNTYHQ